jgi:hypothetical protein
MSLKDRHVLRPGHHGGVDVDGVDPDHRGGPLALGQCATGTCHVVTHRTVDPE